MPITTFTYTKCRYCQKHEGDIYYAFGRTYTLEFTPESERHGLCGGCYEKHYTGQTSAPKSKKSGGKCDCERPSCRECNE